MIQKYNIPAVDEKTKKFSYTKEQWVEFFQTYKKLIDSHVMPDTKYYASFGKSNMYEMKPWIQVNGAAPTCGTPPSTNIPTT